MANESGLLGEEGPDWLMVWLTGRISPTVPSVNTSVENRDGLFSPYIGRRRPSLNRDNWTGMDINFGGQEPPSPGMSVADSLKGLLGDALKGATTIFNSIGKNVDNEITEKEARAKENSLFTFPDIPVKGPLETLKSISDDKTLDSSLKKQELGSLGAGQLITGLMGFPATGIGLAGGLLQGQGWYANINPDVYGSNITWTPSTNRIEGESLDGSGDFVQYGDKNAINFLEDLATNNPYKNIQIKDDSGNIEFFPLSRYVEDQAEQNIPIQEAIKQFRSNYIDDSGRATLRNDAWLFEEDYRDENQKWELDNRYGQAWNELGDTADRINQEAGETVIGYNELVDAADLISEGFDEDQAFGFVSDEDYSWS